MDRDEDTEDWTGASLLEQAVEHERKRQASFKVTDPATCSHSMVYCKQDDDMHCNFCDKYMYNLAHAE